VTSALARWSAPRKPTVRSVGGVPAAVIPSSSNSDRKLSSFQSSLMSTGERLVKQTFVRCSSEIAA
jgi:hypothetical protein